MRGVSIILARLILVLSTLAPLPAFAACTNPVGAAGDIMYSSTANTMYYCNNTNWIVMGANVPSGFGSLTTGDFCTAAAGSIVNCTTGAVSLTSQVAGTLPVANGGTGATSFSPGSVLFAGTGGVFTQDNSNLFWDNTNNRLGVGLSTPVAPLNVYTNTTGSPSLTSDSTEVANIEVATVQLAMGVLASSPYSFWLQAKQYSNSGADFPIVLNPLGGNVGIGTASPNQMLDVENTTSSDTKAIFVNTDTSAGNVGLELRSHATGGEQYIDFADSSTSDSGSGTPDFRNRIASTSTALYFETSASVTPLTLLNGGAVGIGMTAPTTALMVSGTISSSVLPADASNQTVCYATSNSGTSGYDTIGYCSSDRRLKHDIVYMSGSEEGLNAIDALKPARFKWNGDKDDRVVAGFIAQDTMKGAPEAVGMPADSKYYSFDSVAVLSYTVKAVQELKALFDKLEVLVGADHNDIARLKADNDDLRREVEALRVEVEHPR